MNVASRCLRFRSCFRAPPGVPRAGKPCNWSSHAQRFPTPLFTASCRKSTPWSGPTPCIRPCPFRRLRSRQVVGRQRDHHPLHRASRSICASAFLRASVCPTTSRRRSTLPAIGMRSVSCGIPRTYALRGPRARLQCLQSQLVGWGALCLPACPRSDPFYVAVHRPGLIQFFECGPFTSPDFTSGILVIKVPKPASLSVFFDPGTKMAGDLPFEGVGLEVLGKDTLRPSYSRVIWRNGAAAVNNFRWPIWHRGLTEPRS